MYKQLIITELVKEAGRKPVNLTPKGSPLSIMITDKSKGQQRYNIQRFNGDIKNRKSFKETFMPTLFNPHSVSTNTVDANGDLITPMAYLEHVGILNKSLKGKLPNKARKQLTKPLMQEAFSQINSVFNSPKNTTTKGYLKSFIGPIGSKRLKEIQDDADMSRTAEMVQYIQNSYLKNFKNEKLRNLGGSLRFETLDRNPNNSSYGPGDNIISLGANANSLPVIIHESGHGLNFLKPRNKFIMQMYGNIHKGVEPYERLINTKRVVGKRADGTDIVGFNPIARMQHPEQARDLSRFMQEIEANRQGRKMMRSVLAGNKPLYDEFRRLQYETVMPALAAYTNSKEDTIRDMVINKRLPKPLQRRAENYLKQYDKHKEFLFNRHLSKIKDPVKRQEAIDQKEDIISDLIADYVTTNTIRTKPKNKEFTKRLYEYLQTQGMQPSPNMWHSNLRIGPNTSGYTIFQKMHKNINNNKKYMSTYGRPLSTSIEDGDTWIPANYAIQLAHKNPEFKDKARTILKLTNYLDDMGSYIQ